MAHYVEDIRHSEIFVAGSLETLLPQDSVARSIQAALDRLDFSSFDAQHQNDTSGRAALNPRALVAVWLLALLHGQTVAATLATLCGRDVEYRWLLGGAAVEKSTLSAFRKENGDQIAALSTQVLMALGQCGLLPGANLGVDGTILRAASSRHSVKTRKGLKKQAERLKTLLDERLAEEEPLPERQIHAVERRQHKISQALDQMHAMGLTDDKDRLNTTEPAAKLLRQKNGSYAPGYNLQVVSDLNSGVIVHAQIIDAGNDCGQLQPQMEEACAVLKEMGVGDDDNTKRTLTSDGAYHDTRQLAQLETQGITCYVPEDRNTNRQNPNASPQYQASAFTYDADTDTYACPQGQTLTYRKESNTRTSAIYQAKTSVCANCPAKHHCCPQTKEGRYLSRSLYKEVLDTVAQRFVSDEGQVMKNARGITCEGVFARLKQLLHWGRCRLWGEKGVKAELAWRLLAHNLMLLTGVWKPMIGLPHTG